MPFRFHRDVWRFKRTQPIYQKSWSYSDNRVSNGPSRAMELPRILQVGIFTRYISIIVVRLRLIAAIQPQTLNLSLWKQLLQQPPLQEASKIVSVGVLMILVVHCVLLVTVG